MIDVNSALNRQMVRWRREFHMRPELAFQEFETANTVARVLSEAGLEVVEGIGGTGVVATLTGNAGKGRVVGLRADMDALPVTELNTFEHRSTIDGQMHACGHDGHTAMLLGAAVALAEDPGFSGKVHFVFQPAEEGAGGAKAMIDDGLFDRFPMDEVYALHNWPSLDLGEAAVHCGAAMAGYDTFRIEVNGTGCHAAMPHQGIDPILAIGSIISMIHGIVSRNIDPQEAAVVSITRVQGGESYNVIPEKAELGGSVRALSASVQATIRRRIEEIAANMATASGCKIELQYIETYPATINSENEAVACAKALQSTPGVHKTYTSMAPSMASEDFSYMLSGRRGCYIWLGGGRSGSCHGLHSPYFDFNDEALLIGANYWIRLVTQILNSRA